MVHWCNGRVMTTTCPFCKWSRYGGCEEHDVTNWDDSMGHFCNWWSNEYYTDADVWNVGVLFDACSRRLIAIEDCNRETYECDLDSTIAQKNHWKIIGASLILRFDSTRLDLTLRIDRRKTHSTCISLLFWEKHVTSDSWWIYVGFQGLIKRPTAQRKSVAKGHLKYLIHKIYHKIDTTTNFKNFMEVMRRQWCESVTSVQ
jgi:hypothetical protein